MGAYFKKIARAAIEKWGALAQVFMMIEEMAELTQALSKWHRGKPNFPNIHKEIADVQIMLDQMKVLFHCEKEVENIMGDVTVELARKLRCDKLEEE